jgi:hypothetical protein
MNNYRTLTENDLASFAERIVDLLAGTELPSLDAAVKADFVTAFGTLPASLKTKADAVTAREDDRMAAVSDRNMAAFQLIRLIGQFRDALRSALAPKKEFDLCGLEYPFSPRSNEYIAKDPSDLAVTGFSNGVNKGRFKGNNVRGQVMYDIWRRVGDEGVWTQHLLTRKQSFVDTGVTPGQYYEYRVRAVAAKNVSQWSNSAVVYGIL